MGREFKKIICFTGGGTSGHVVPNIALAEKFSASGWEVFYIGSRTGIEHELVLREKIPFMHVSSGKLRRYFSFRNLTDIFRIFCGFFQSLCILLRKRPDALFSKGGFVSPPAVWAAWILRIPVYIHESDLTPGLANRISFPFCKKIFVSFPDTVKNFSENVVLSGVPVRKNILNGTKKRGLEICRFDSSRPVILVTGGSLGSQSLNRIVRDHLQQILKKYQICHLCGRGNLDKTLENINGYHQEEYVHEDLAHLFAASEIVVSRAGATAVSEILAMKKPSLLIPLPLSQSRGDQIENARYLENYHLAVTVSEDELQKKFSESLEKLENNREEIRKNIEKLPFTDSAEIIFDLIDRQT